MIEVIALNLEDAKIIENHGCDRIKLVSGITEGGITPSYALIEKVVNNINIPVNVVVKPNSNSFVYSDFDMEVLLRDIEIIRNLGVNYISFTSLNEDDSININQLENVIKVSKNMNIIFNNSFDFSNKSFSDIEILKKYKEINNILISIEKNKLTHNIESIKQIDTVLEPEKLLLNYNFDLYNIDNIKSKTNIANFSFGNNIRINKSPFNKIDEYKLNRLLEKLK